MPGNPDPFLRQLTWLVDEVGGKEALARACDRQVGVRTLDTWMRGGYPRTTVTPAVRAVDAWAMAHRPGYPELAGAPRLTASCGPPPSTPLPAPAAGPGPGPRRSPARWLALALGQVAVLAATAGVALDVLAPPAAGRPPASTAVLPGPLPTQGDGSPRPQTVSAGPVTTYGDPRGLTAGTGAIPPGTTVQVRCRVLAAPEPAAGLEGWWYLVETGSWAGQWAAAESFGPGADPGSPAGYPVDEDVPECRDPFAGLPGG